MDNFIKTIMQQDLESGKHDEIITRFPPEPNAYLHIGHARAIITNFELAKEFNGKTNLRFDDTNPVKEDAEYVEAIKEDLAWLGYTPANVFYGSDYFEKTYEKAILLIKKGLAYVCDLSQEEMSKYRGTLTEPGKNSPYRDRSIEENLDLFERMRKGEFADGSKTLRAKIDMASPNINLRDPALYRIIHINHHRQGNKWCIFPMYDFAHPLQDSFEGITHSLCSLEYDNHRVLYDWAIENCECEKVPHQYEFGRLNITNTIMSKRYLRMLVESNKVSGYDDQRMPTLVGLRRRGYTAEAIKNFIISTGLSRVNSTVSSEMLDEALRDDLKLKADRRMAIMHPLKVTITNYPEDKIEYLEVSNNVENENATTRKISFSNSLYIDQEDFLEEKPNKKWKRLSKDIEVRLFGAYFIKCNEVIKDDKGNVIELKCTYDPATKSGSGFDERKPNGTIHYVDAKTCKKAKFLFFEPLLLDEASDKSFLENLNPNSITELNGFVEESLGDTKVGEKYQFLRVGYFCTDKLSTKDNLIFNRITPLKSSM